MIVCSCPTLHPEIQIFGRRGGGGRLAIGEEPEFA